MATKKSPSTTKSTSKSAAIAATVPARRGRAGGEPGQRDAYTVELARISGILLVGLLAIMTFLLSAGLQHPHIWFNIFFYASLATLALNLVLFAVGNLLQPSPARATFRIVQQGAFIVSILAVTGFMIMASMLFFAAPTAGSSGSAGTTQSGA